jgi:tape measure domain-containing protein
MGQQIHELRGVIQGDASGWLRAVKQSINAGQDFLSAWGRAASEVVSLSTKVAVGITGMATAVGTAVAVTGTKFNALQQNATIAFSTLLRDGTKAKAFLQELQKFAAETPFSFGGLIKNSQFLLATGTSLAEIIPTLRVLGDTMAGLGKGEEELKLVATALSQIRGSAQLSAADMAQLTNQGIPAWKMLADAIGKTVGETRKLSEQGAFGGEQAFQILMGGLKERFGGGMAAAGGTFDQLLSNLKDTFDIRAAEVTKPLFDALIRVFQQFNEFLGSPQFSGVIQELTGQFARAGSAIERWLGGNRQQIIEGLTSALRGMAEGVTNLIQWVQEAGPGMMRFAQVLGDVAGAVGRFSSRHPEVLAALLLFQGASMLGVISTLGALGNALVSTISLFVKLVPAIAGASTATVSFTALLAPGIALAIAGGFFAILINSARELRAEFDEFIKSTEKVRNLGLEGVREGMNRSGGIQDPQARRNALRVDLEAAKQELENAQRDMEARRREREKIGRDMSVGDRISAMLPEAIGGFDARTEAGKEAERAQARWERASAVISEIEAKIKETEAQIKSGAAGAGAGAMGVGPVPPEVAATGPIQQQAVDAVKRWNDMVGDVTTKMEGMALKLADMGLYMDPVQIQMVADSMQRLGDAFLNGEITEAQFNQLTSGLQRVADQAGNFSEKIQQAAETGKISGDQLGALNTSLSQLLGQYQQGAITSDGFARGLQQLNAQMEAGAAQAEREAAAKERARLMSGQFTGQEFQTALEDRIIAFQRQRMQQMVDMQFLQWQRMNGFMTDTGNNFGRLNGMMGGFGTQVQRATGFLRGMGGDGANALNWNSIAAAFNSPQAQRDMLFNELQMLLQYFRPNTSPYSMGLDPERAARYQGRIDEIQSILNAPPPPPMFTGISGDQIVGDPGLQSQSARAGGSINVNLPNISRITNSDIRQITDALTNELARQGRRL